ncbi:hypothetical protein EJ06DRAFT_529109 [Trichodelitschia bisporula]|uniref:Uncharacterized protein n=1 Tax=Trichodelitschia bisporula TaxID=703511 RepID=A0A6G1I1L9_9PEZI|nr:hypothetical protein EJ06DRAFT_529109 [Trichodelitschia bisporula]
MRLRPALRHHKPNDPLTRYRGSSPPAAPHRLGPSPGSHRAAVTTRRSTTAHLARVTARASSTARTSASPRTQPGRLTQAIPAGHAAAATACAAPR